MSLVRLAFVVVAAVGLLSGRPAFASSEADLDAIPGGLNRVSQNVIIIRGQLELGLTFARQALTRLQTAPAAETPETLDRTIRHSYVQLRFGVSGVNLKREAARMNRFSNPLLELAAGELEKAMVQIRLASQTSTGVSAERPDMAQKVASHLEATISIVEGVLNLL